MTDIVIAGVCLALFWAGPGSDFPPATGSGGRPAEIEHLQVALLRTGAMTDAELETIRDQLRRIWRQEGIVIDFTTSPAPAPGLRVVLTDTPIHVTSPTRNLCDLGAIRFVNGTPEPQVTVSIGAARAFVREARPEWSPVLRTLIAARIAGRVAAHEIGHYLLGEPGHRSHGLMRARFDGADLLGAHLGAFAPPHRVDIEAGLIRATSAMR